MLKKYYVTCGDLKHVTHAFSEPQAIFFAFDKMMSQNIEKLSSFIRVSQRGHEQHDDDEIHYLSDMFALWILNKNWNGKVDGLPE